MKKVVLLFIFLLALGLFAVGCGSTEKPTPQDNPKTEQSHNMDGDMSDMDHSEMNMDDHANNNKQ